MTPESHPKEETLAHYRQREAHGNDMAAWDCNRARNLATVTEAPLLTDEELFRRMEARDGEHKALAARIEANSRRREADRLSDLATEARAFPDKLNPHDD